MSPQDTHRHSTEALLFKLIFAILSAMFVVMTAIGGATASHMITQNDDIIKRLSSMEAESAAQQVYRLDLERRLDTLEQKLDKIERNTK